MTFYSDTSDSLLSSPRTNKCIVLDLDETLVHASDDMTRFHRLKIASDPKLMDIRDRSYTISLDDVIERRGTGTKTQLWAITRPYFKEFLVFCFNHFKIVAVWSAGRYKYVHATVEAIFKDVAMPHIIYTWDDCEKSTKGIFKPLEKMIRNEPGMDKYMSLTNTLAIDDRESTYSKNPYNGVRIPEYKPHFTIHGLRVKDNGLLQLMNWFKRQDIIDSPDVRTLDKNVIFTQSLSDNPSNVPDISSTSLVSDRLLVKKGNDNIQPPKQQRPFSPQMFLPNRCIDSNGDIICDPQLQPLDLLDGPNEIIRVVNPVGSPMVAFSPSRSPMPNNIYSPGNSPIRLKLPLSPTYSQTTEREDTSRPPDSPTFARDTNRYYQVRVPGRSPMKVPGSSRERGGFSRSEVPTYYGNQRDITGSQAYVRVPS